MQHQSPRRKPRLQVGLFLTASLAALLAFSMGTSTAEERPDGAELKARQQAPSELAQSIDQIIDTKLEAEEVRGAPRSNDAEFLRRIYLDLVGTVPSVDEVETFLGSRSADKRRDKINELLASDAYAENFGVIWFKTTTGLSPAARRGRGGQGARYIQGKAGETYLAWLQDQMANNRPYDAWVNELLTASGRTDENGATGFIARWSENTNNLASATAKTFLGTRIQCAQCHDHIYEDEWKQKDFRGMAAFFGSLKSDRSPEYRQFRQLQRQVRELEQAKRKGQAAPGMSDEMDGGMDSMQPGDAKDGKRPQNRKRGRDQYKGNSKLPTAAEIAGMDRQARQAMLRQYRGTANVLVISDTTANPRAVAAAKRRLEAQLKRKNNPNLERVRERMALAATTPKFWMAAEAADIPGIPRRLLLARWVTAEDNQLFARTVVNRYWGHFLGAGVVDPVDDFNSFNDASHPEILDLLALDFVSNGFDLKRLIRTIVSTEAYQRTSEWTGKEAPDAQLFARAPVRPLSTEQLYHSLVRASGLERRLDRNARRAGQQVQQAIFSVFSFVFDDDEGKEAQDFSGSIPQGLFLMNGDLMQRVVAAGRGSLLNTLMRTKRSEGDRVEYLYLTTYGRKPTSSEKQGAVRFLKAEAASQGGVDKAYEDLLWALLNSAEFMTNH